MALEGLEPEEVFYFFGELTLIPRGSGNERAAGDHLMSFAAERGYKARRDEVGNVLITVPASPGCESSPAVMLQAHIDMVCAQEPGRGFDFEKEPIETYIEAGFVRARGTTLGADDGIGAALILSLIDDKTLRRPPLKALFTVGEETMLYGARALDASWLDTDYIIGLDYSDAGSVLVSCAGTGLVSCALPVERESAPAGGRVYRLSLSGLQGGHSGKDIHLPRGNAIKMTAELIRSLSKIAPLGLISLSGGELMNLIPVGASAELYCAEGGEGKLERAMESLADGLRSQWGDKEPGLTVEWSARPAEMEQVMKPERSERLLNFLASVPTGAHAMADEAAPRAEASSNLAVLREDKGLYTAQISTRGNTEALHDEVIERIRETAAQSGVSVRLESRSPAWEYEPEQRLLKLVRRVELETEGREIEIKKIHAGVEAGVFLEKAAAIGKKPEIVNLGCTTLEMHTPRERLDIFSVGRTYDRLRRVLSALAEGDTPRL